MVVLLGRAKHARLLRIHLIWVVACQTSNALRVQLASTPMRVGALASRVLPGDSQTPNKLRASCARRVGKGKVAHAMSAHLVAKRIQTRQAAPCALIWAQRKLSEKETLFTTDPQVNMLK